MPVWVVLPGRSLCAVGTAWSQCWSGTGGLVSRNRKSTLRAILKGHGMIETTVRGRAAVVQYRALHHKILVLAKANTDTGDWKAYIAPVPGEDHEKEWPEVFERGSPILQDLAEFLFPEFAKKFAWRR